MSISEERLVRCVIAPILASKEHREYLKRKARERWIQIKKEVLPRKWQRYSSKRKERVTFSIWDSIFKANKGVEVIKEIKKKPSKVQLCKCTDIVSHFLYCKYNGPFRKV